MNNKIDISDLPPPPEVQDVDISDLPPPPQAASVDISDLPPPPPSMGSQGSPDYTRLREEMELGIGESISQSPWLQSNQITNKDLETLAQKHGVNVAELRGLSPLLGADLENATGAEERRKWVGRLGQAVTLGIPQWLMKKAQSPEMERALDDVRRLADQRRSLLVSALDVVAPGGAIVAAGKGLGKKALAGAATGAVYGLTGSRQGEEVPSTLVGAGLGAAIPTAGEAIGKAPKAARVAIESIQEAITRRNPPIVDISDNVARRITEASTADDLLIQYVTNANKKLTEADATEIMLRYGGRAEGPEQIMRGASNLINKEAEKLSEQLGAAGSQNPRVNVQAALGEGVVSGRGREFVEGRLRRNLQERHALDALEELGGYNDKAYSAIDRALDFLSDAQYVLRATDDKVPGLGIEEAHQKLNRQLNTFSGMREADRAHIGKIFVDMRKLGLDNRARVAGDIIQKYEQGGMGALSDAEKAVMRPFAEFFNTSLDELKESANKLGVKPLEIKQRANYVPSRLLPYAQLDNVMADRIRYITDKAGVREINQVPQDTLLKLINEDTSVKETLDFINKLSGGAAQYNPVQLGVAYKKLFGQAGNRMPLENLASAALERKDAIPYWAREQDLYRLADGWSQNTLRNMAIREPLDQLRSAARILTKANMEPQANYINKLADDLIGIRESTGQELTSKWEYNFVRKMDRKAREATDPAKKQQYEMLRGMPSALRALSTNIHANLLGGNPRTAVMNLTQTITKTIPEFGGPYGTSLGVRAMLNASRGRGLKGLNETLQRAEKLGYEPAKHVSGATPYLAEFGRGATGSFLRKTSELSSDVLMAPFQMAEKINRGMALSMSELFVDDLNKGSKRAMEALRRMPVAIQRRVLEGQAQGGPEGVRKMFLAAADHIVANSQYHYNRASMSEYGRTMGPVFSVFSKWPTATLGQVVYEFRSKPLPAAVATNAQKLIAPWLLLQAGDAMYLAATGRDVTEDMSPRESKFISKSGLSAAAPIQNLVGIASGDFLTPPVIDLANKAFIKPSLGVIKGDTRAVEALPEAAMNGIAEGVYQFAPGGIGGWLRTAFDDVATIVTGDRPEGQDLPERIKSTLE
mgnify:CR=1 FL=1